MATDDPTDPTYAPPGDDPDGVAVIRDAPNSPGLDHNAVVVDQVESGVVAATRRHIQESGIPGVTYDPSKFDHSKLGTDPAAAFGLGWDWGKFFSGEGTPMARSAIPGELAPATPGHGTPKYDFDSVQEHKNQKQNTQPAEIPEPPAAFETTVQYKEQCFLLAFIKDFVIDKKNMDQRGKAVPYQNGGNASLLVDGDPAVLINRLTQYENQKEFYNMEVKDLSTLQPLIQLFKVVTDENGNESELEISFDSHLTPCDMELFMGGDKLSRGHGVGIKDFTFSYEAENPFAIKKSIKAKLTLFANSFEELLRPRGGSRCDEGTYTYLDLALKTGSKLTADALNTNEVQLTDEAYDNLSKLNFRLKAVVGWALPNGHLPGGGKLEEGSVLRDAIYNSYITVNLTPTIHEFNIDDLGRVTLGINYLAYVEDFFDQPSFNVFSENGVNARILERKLKFKVFNKGCDSKEIDKLKQDEKINIRNDKILSLQTIIRNLADKTKVVNIPYKKLTEFMDTGQSFDISTLIQDDVGSELLTEITEEAVAAETGPPEPPKEGDPLPEAPLENMVTAIGLQAPRTHMTALAKAKDQLAPTSYLDNESLPFFYISDLVDTIMAGIEGFLKNAEAYLMGVKISPSTDSNVTDADVNEVTKAEIELARRLYQRFKKLRIVLGPVEIVSPKNSAESGFYNLGDIPVSVRYFAQWVTKVMLKRDEALYPMTKFFNDFFNQFVRDFLNDDGCFDGSVKQKVRLSQTALTSYSPDDQDEFAAILSDRGSATGTDWRSWGRLNIMDENLEQPILNIAGERNNPGGYPVDGFLNEYNYLIYFVGRTNPTKTLVGDRAEDERSGIFHYAIGRDNGIVKTIDFTKTDAGPSLKMVRFEQQGYDGLQQLREQYDVNIKTFANVNAFPGAYIYVNPKGFSPSSEVDLERLGIGGYHMIIRTEHSFGPGKAESTIIAKWVQEAVREAETAGEADLISRATNDSPEKCFLATNRESGAKSTSP